jgi:hypothetical protein
MFVWSHNQVGCIVAVDGARCEAGREAPIHRSVEAIAERHWQARFQAERGIGPSHDYCETCLVLGEIALLVGEYGDRNAGFSRESVLHDLSRFVG